MNARNSDGMTPLMLAAMLNGERHMIQTLVHGGARVNERGPGGKSALMYAVQFTMNPEVISALLVAGADRNLKSDAGLTAWDYSKANPNLAGTSVPLVLRPGK